MADLIRIEKGAEQHAEEETAQMRAWLKWAKETLGLKNANDDPPTTVARRRLPPRQPDRQAPACQDP